MTEGGRLHSPLTAASKMKYDKKEKKRDRLCRVYDSTLADEFPKRDYR